MIRTHYSRKHKVAFLVIAALLFAFAAMLMPWAYEHQFTYHDPTQNKTVVTTERTWIWTGFNQPTGQVRAGDFRTARPAWGTWAFQFAQAAMIFFGIWTIVTYELRCARWNRGQCEQCGYDLRAGGLTRCPECGRARSRHYPDPLKDSGL